MTGIPPRQKPRRSLTGAWIETRALTSAITPERVAPSRERGLKLSMPSGLKMLVQVAPSRERGLKLPVESMLMVTPSSLPHGSVD